MLTPDFNRSRAAASRLRADVSPVKSTIKLPLLTFRASCALIKHASNIHTKVMNCISDTCRWILLYFTVGSLVRSYAGVLQSSWTNITYFIHSKTSPLWGDCGIYVYLIMLHVIYCSTIITQHWNVLKWSLKVVQHSSLCLIPLILFGESLTGRSLNFKF